MKLREVELKHRRRLLDFGVGDDNEINNEYEEQSYAILSTIFRYRRRQLLSYVMSEITKS
jgi:hypothetical protein